MANEHIELYKPWDVDRAKDRVFFVSRKLDGVPVRIRKLSGKTFAWSRQGELITSIQHIIPYVANMIGEGGSVVGELHIEGVPFKDISGLVRRKVGNTETAQLVFNVFDFDILNSPETPYARRWQEFDYSFRAFRERERIEPPACPVRLMPHIIAHGPNMVQRAFETIMEANPNAEGAVAHWIGKPFQPGTRRWDTMKLKPHETLDVEVVGYEEAVDKYKRPKDMVGGIQIKLWSARGGKLTHATTNVGPGCMTLRERKIEWAKFKQGKFRTRIAEVHSMPDDTYNGLREGRWIRWRDDKEGPDVRQREMA